MEDLSLDNWKQIQTKTFTKWVNSKLKKANYPQIQNLFTDLSTGEALVNLLASLGKQIPKYNISPNSRIKKMENLTIILDFIRSQNISLVNIGPEDIVDGDQKLILGLVWTLISKMSISEAFTRELLSLRDEVLTWAQRVTSCYDHVKIQNLTTDWQDGISFNAVVHRFRPELVKNFFNLDSAEAFNNCENLFKIAEDCLDIPRLFDPEDIIDVVKPDEKSILTYLSQFFVKFTAEEAKINAKNALSHVFKGINISFETRNSYEYHAKNFLNKKKAFEETLNSAKNTFKTLLSEFEDMERVNSELIGDSVFLHSLLDNIAVTDKTFNLKNYSPPNDLRIENIRSSEYLKPENHFNVQNLLNFVTKFDDKEANEIEKYSSQAYEIFSCKNEEEQLSLSGNCSIKTKEFDSSCKQNEYERMREIIKAKITKLNLQKEHTENTNKLISSAEKHFKLKDLKKTGFISSKDCLKILRQLNLDGSISEEGKKEKITIDDLKEIIQRICMMKNSKEQIRKAFESLSNDLTVNLTEILPSVTLKGFNGIVSNNLEISYENLIGLFED